VALVTILEPRAAAYPDKTAQLAARRHGIRPLAGDDPDRLCARPRCFRPGPEGRSESRIIAALDASPAMVYRVRKQLVEEASRRY
jgi:hypothetical protein